jgi:hypothetical protein
MPSTDLLQNDFLEKEKSMVDRTALILDILHNTPRREACRSTAPRVSQATARKDVDAFERQSGALVSGFEDRKSLRLTGVWPDRIIVPKQKIDV